MRSKLTKNPNCGVKENAIKAFLVEMANSKVPSDKLWLIWRTSLSEINTTQKERTLNWIRFIQQKKHDEAQKLFPNDENHAD